MSYSLLHIHEILNYFMKELVNTEASLSQTIVLLPLNYLGDFSLSVNNFIVHFLYLYNYDNSRNITMVWALSNSAGVLFTSERGGGDG